MRSKILKTIIDFSKDEDGGNQRISPTVFGFLADDIYNVIKSQQCSDSDTKEVLVEVLKSLDEVYKLIENDQEKVYELYGEQDNKRYFGYIRAKMIIQECVKRHKG